jgi:hypothetical protein
VLIESLKTSQPDAQHLALDSLYYCCERLEPAIQISLDEGLLCAFLS